MGQAYITANLDKGEVLEGATNKLLHLSNGGSAYLVPLLGIPFVSSSAESLSPAPNAGVGSWAGDRLICAGNHSFDLPLDLLTSTEYAAVRSLPLVRGGGRGGVPEGDLFLYACDKYKRTYGIPGAHARAYFPADRAWVLRNLTKREYVRAEALALYPDECEGPFVGVPGVRPGLGEAIMSRIAWSSDFSDECYYGEGITRGVWAGDRFDIRAVGTVDLESDDELEEPWKDVSTEVACETFCTWDKFRAHGWRQCFRDGPPN
jgi:hypothetical protein